MTGTVAGDPDAHVCEKFRPKWPAPEVVTFLKRLSTDAGPTGTRLPAALARWSAGPPNDVEVQTWHLPTRMSVSEGGLEGFGSERRLSDTRRTDFEWADVFGPVRVRRALVFFLSAENPAGVGLSVLPGSFLLVLGPEYTFAHLAAAISAALEAQSVRVTHPYAAQLLAQRGLDPRDPAYRALWAPDSVGRSG